jgi:Fe(3+) dicitrate transport protein
MKYLYILSFLLINALQLSAQTVTISGTVKSADGNGIANATVSIKNTRNATHCDTAGNFQLSVAAGSHTITITAIGFKPVSRSLKVDHDLTLNILLVDDTRELNAVDIKAKKDNNFGITRLKAIEGTNINAGKKSEVIVMDDIIANKATNNARQIYAKVAGLNIL